METKEKIRILLPSIFGTAGLVLGMLFDIPSYNLPIGIWVFLIFAGVQVYVLFSALEKAVNKRPNVVPDISVYNKLERSFPFWNMGVHTDYEVKRYYLPFRNVAPEKGHVNLEDTEAVNAIVTFYDTNHNELLKHEKAFWFNAQPRVLRKTKEDHIFKIPASGEAEGVCLIIRKEGDEELYIFNDDSYYPGTASIVLSDAMKIKDKVVDVKVELTMANFKMNPVWARITNLGKDKEPLITLIDALL